MRIVANKIETKWERDTEQSLAEEWIRARLFTALGQELHKYNPLYYKETRDSGDIEYKVEAFIFNRETLRNILKDIQSIWLTMINSI